MQITNHNDAIVITNPNPEYMRLAVIATGLKLEIRTNGAIKLTRGPKCSTLARKLGFKGNREALLRQVLERKEEIARELGLIKE